MRIDLLSLSRASREARAWIKGIPSTLVNGLPPCMAGALC